MTENSPVLIRASEGDLAKLREAYTEIIRDTPDMEARTHWIYGIRPSDGLLLEHIGRGELYYTLDGGIVSGAVAVTDTQSEDYRAIGWKTQADEAETAVVHLLAVRPAYSGTPLARSIMEQVCALAGSAGKKAVRLDVLATNVPAVRFYEKCGFVRCGEGTRVLAEAGPTAFLYCEFAL